MRALLHSLLGGIRAHLLALLNLIGIGIVTALMVTGGLYVASQRSGFCITCHYMKPYYRQWQTSSHSEVACVECHPMRPLHNAVSALRYATDTYDPRPRAEVASTSCLQAGCHDDRMDAGVATATDGVAIGAGGTGVEVFGGILFDHRAHMQTLRRGKQLQCTSCHSQIVQGEHIAVTQETCFLCHFKDVGEAQAIGGCTNCHDAPGPSVQHGGFIFSHEHYLRAGVACEQCHLEVVQGDGAVPQERCFSCHVERRKQGGDALLLHATHVTEHDIDCFACHEQIEHGDVRLIRALDTACETCHQSLHSPQKEMYLGAGGRGVSDLPSRMFAARVSCDGCHTQVVHLGTPEFDQANLEAQRQTCVDCHGAGYDDMLDDWLRETRRLETLLTPEVAAAEAAVARSGEVRQDMPMTRARLLVQNARHNLDLLTAGHGAHNVEYAVRLAQASTRFVDEARGLIDDGYRPPRRPELLASPDGYCMIMCHARTGLPEETRFEVMDFPHRLHAEDLDVECTTCHSPDKHKMQIITRSECMSCHHGAQDIDCAHCHPSVAALYNGDSQDWGVEGYADVMADAGVECTECHDLSEPLSIPRIQTGCVECHDEEYGEMLAVWLNEIQAATGTAEVHLDELEHLVGERRRPPAALVRQLEAAATRINLVDAGKGGVHNYELSREVLEQVETDLREVRQQLAPRSASR